MVFKGIAITQGAGEAIAVATGMDTEIPQTSYPAESASAEVAPLERRLDRPGHRLVWVTLALAGLTIAGGVLREHDLAAMIQTGVAIALAAVPEGLPVVATLSLARGMKRMADRNALITQLSSVETLGATTVILTDKTGTLTENRTSAVRYLLSGLDVEVRQNGDKIAFAAQDEVLNPDKDERLGWPLKIGTLCNNAELGDDNRDAKSGFFRHGQKRGFHRIA
jgi:Ca2+-transporting ATPase